MIELHHRRQQPGALQIDLQPEQAPAAEEQDRHHDEAGGDHVDVFAEENRPNFRLEYSVW